MTTANIIDTDDSLNDRVVLGRLRKAMMPSRRLFRDRYHDDVNLFRWIWLYKASRFKLLSYWYLICGLCKLKFMLGLARLAWVYWIEFELLQTFLPSNISKQFFKDSFPIMITLRQPPHAYARRIHLFCVGPRVRKILRPIQLHHITFVFVLTVCRSLYENKFKLIRR